MSKKKKLKVGIVGMGFIGPSHIENARRVGSAEVIGILEATKELTQEKADLYNVPKCYGTIEEMLADPEIDVVHNCTPTNLHLEYNKKIIEAGKHLFSEKPLTRTSAESRELLDTLKKHPNVVVGVNYNYRMNPLVQDMKHRIAEGEIGEPILIHGGYLQDWLLYETDYSWRIDPEISGPSRCVGDIGSHWMDTVQAVTGLQIVEVCANVVTTIPVRKKAVGPVETFAVNTSSEYEDVPVKTEDYAGVLVKFSNGASGVFQCSEVSAGHKNGLTFEIDGQKASFAWGQETADHMWKGTRDRSNELIIRSPGFMSPESQKYTYMAAGHPEGWNDALTNNIRSFYDFILAGKKNGDPADFATFEESHYIMRLIEAILLSGKERRWVSIDEIKD